METHDTRTGTDLTAFSYQGTQLRTVLVDGDPWFVAADLARLLGYREAKDAVRLLDEDMKGRQIVPTLGGKQEMLVVSEPGMYRLIMRSQRDEARAIERWVVGTVLPSIRRTGSYSVAPVVAHPAIPTTYADALQLAADQARMIDRQKAEIEAATVRASVLEPAAEAWTQMVAAGGDVSLRAAAKILGSSGCRIRVREFYLWLHAQRWIYRDGGAGDWAPYAPIGDQGLMTTRLVAGRSGKIKQQARVTMSGMEKLRAMLIADRGTAAQQQQTSLELVVSR